MNCLSSHWYDGFETQELILLFLEVQEKATASVDPIEKEYWKMRRETIESELVRRQEIENHKAS